MVTAMKRQMLNSKQLLELREKEREIKREYNNNRKNVAIKGTLKQIKNDILDILRDKSNPIEKLNKIYDYTIKLN